MNANQYLKALEQLRGWRQSAFILALAERAFPNYALFAEAVELRGGRKMRPLLDEAWDLFDLHSGESKAPTLLARLETLSPGIDRYDAYGVYPAFDFCQLLEQALLTWVNPDRNRAMEAATLATGTVAQFIEMSEGEGMDDNEMVRLLDQHELMKADKLFQRETLLNLKRQRTPTEEFIDGLREEAANDGVSNLGVALESDG